MGTLITITITLIVYHFVIEAIVLPDYRMAQRFKLQAIKDDVEYELISRVLTKERKRALEHIRNLCDVAIKHLAEFDLIVIFKANRMAQNDKELQRLHQEYAAIAMHPEQKDLLKIQVKFGQIVGKTALKNHLGLLPYLLVIGVPILLLVIVGGFIVKKCRRFLRKTKSILFNPQLKDTNPSTLEALFSTGGDDFSWN
jgi:hypothetical protein